MNDGKVYKVIIFGKEYTLTTDEPEEQVRKIAHNVDTLMCTIAGKNNIRDGNKIAVLAALRLAHEVFTLEQQISKQHYDEKRLIDLIDHVLTSSSDPA